jgi:lipid-A-disaccharide synthase
MRYYIIAGEASGDLHGGNLVREIRRRDADADIRCWGGDRMEAAGAVLVKHYRDLAFMGFLEVVANLRTILRNMRLCREDILRFRPDVVVFIDYPGFNIRMASFARRQGFRTVYYISPQVWAWKEGRVKTLRRDVDRMLVILPFEKAFYRGWNWEVEYVGHPLVAEVDARRRASADAGPTSGEPWRASRSSPCCRAPADRRSGSSCPSCSPWWNASRIAASWWPRHRDSTTHSSNPSPRGMEASS